MAVIDNQYTAARNERPLWRRIINRALTWTLNTALWLALWLIMFLLFFVLVLYGDTSMFMARLQQPWHTIIDLAYRVVMTGPFILLLLLTFHPIRSRWWIVRRFQSLGRLIQRGLQRLTRRRPADIAAEVEPANSETVPQPIIELTTPPRTMSRRRFLLESALFGGIVAEAMFIEPYLVRTEYVDIPVPNLPDRFNGLRIAQLSDMHVNGFTTSVDLDRAVSIINSLDPDLVMLTGDFVDWDENLAADATVPFRNLKAREGVYSILGNHDYYTNDIEKVKREIRRQDLGLLVNQHTVLRRGADTLTIIGLDDPRHNHRGANRGRENIDPDAAMRGMPMNGPRLLLVHNPIIVPMLVQNYELDVLLCGHTHGGQFQVPILTDSLVTKAEYFVKGRYDLGPSQLYVNRGFGFTGPPVRFRATPEITLLRLVNAT